MIGKYSPLVNWISVRSFLEIASIHELLTISIVFVIGFPKEDLAVNVFMDLPLGLGASRNVGERVLKLNKSIYGIKQASANWFEILKTGLKRRGYYQSQVYHYLFSG